MTAIGLSFSTLPTEILQAIFEYLPPRSLVATSRTSKRLKVIADQPIIWRYYCRTHFSFWDSRHNIEAKFAGPLSDVDWRALFLERMDTEKKTNSILEEVIATQRNQIANITKIASFGYDAKHTLLQHYNVDDDAEDVLARKYYSNAILERIHREMAIKVWKDLGNGVPIDIERALTAYDMFTLSTAKGDFDETRADLDGLAKELLKENPGFQQWTTREQALALATFLRAREFKGVSDASYSALRNNFIGIVLRSPDHESLPLILVAIYCSIATRLGLDARPCGYPFHVYGLVFSQKNKTLDGKDLSSGKSQEVMYIDPFRSEQEVSEETLRKMLRDMGVPDPEHYDYLRQSSAREVVLRTARNIMNSCQTIRQTEAASNRGNAFHAPSWISTYPDLDNAFYGTLWAMLILGVQAEDSGSIISIATRRRQYLPYLCEHFQQHFPWDVTLVEDYVIPLLYDMPEGQRLLQYANRIHASDRIQKPITARTARAASVKYKVGHLFNHRRYRYEGVITGWDTRCGASEEWIRHMDVDSLSQGRHQSFYHVLVCDKSTRYVAEENIKLATGDVRPSEAMLKLAGRYFKRWDLVNGIFVSNIRDEYPDD
ncbi:F-box domain-containing protein [Lepidopterella palustris CBS 459.81]|uniref:F-box domain-containing protein n=1 Tax=Lepidopterella palustris CBS 459.81 TaxID=1314670 RepID=A0A8E2EB64_9PEZI|nr:F-box domain-containing protein [Lepidopterella palustris CBS 459.81]